MNESKEIFRLLSRLKQGTQPCWWKLSRVRSCNTISSIIWKLSPRKRSERIYSRDKMVYLRTKLNQSSIEETLCADDDWKWKIYAFSRSSCPSMAESKEIFRLLSRLKQGTQPCWWKLSRVISCNTISSIIRKLITRKRSEIIVQKRQIGILNNEIKSIKHWGNFVCR